MSIPVHIIPKPTRERKAEHDRAVLAKQLLLARYLDPWGPPDIVWCHSHVLVRGYKVILNVYDLLPPRLNGCLSILRLGGAFHSGVQVGVTEYAFGGHPNDDLGITALKKPLFMLREEAEAAVQHGTDEDGSAAANLDWMPTLRSRTVVGWWMGPLTRLEGLLRELRFDESWIGSEYRLLSRNCNHFARAMCTALLRNQLFKPAPGCSHPEGMVPRSITRLPALVLALGYCAPCFVRQLNAPMPLAPHSLNIFHGHCRKARLEAPRSRLLADDRARCKGDTSGTFMVSARASASATAGATGVRPSSKTSGLSIDGSDTAAAATATARPTATATAGGGGYTINWPGTSPLPPANAAAVAAAAAAAAEGRLMRPRLEGRYQSLRVETAPRPSMELPSRGAFRRCSDDGGGGGGGGVDTLGHASTGCSTPDMAAIAAAAAAAGGGAGTSVTASNSQLNGNGRQCPHNEQLPSSRATSATAACSSSSGAAATTAAAATLLPQPTSAGPPTTSTSASTSATPTRCTSPGASVTGLASAHATVFSVSLVPPVVVMEATGSGSPPAASSAAAAPVAPVATAAAAATTATTNSSATQPRSSGGSKFLNNHSRSGRRIFPDPRVASPGPDGHPDGTHDHINAFSGDGGAPHLQTPESSMLRDHARSDLDQASVTAASAASSHDGDGGVVVQRLHTTGSAGAAAATASPRHPMLPRPTSSRSQQPMQSPRSSRNGLPPASTRLEGSPSKLATTVAPLPPPPAQLALQHPSPMASPFLRSGGATADGAGSGASATATNSQSPSEVPRPWSVLSGGFVDLLFNPSAAEPPPGVPNQVGIQGRGTSPGVAHPGASGGGGSGSGGGSRRHASFTGDGGAIFSSTANAAVGGLETVRSGDLTDDAQQNPHRAAGRARASTGMLHVGVGVEAAGSSATAGGVLVTSVAGTPSLSAASTSQRRPAVATASTVSRPAARVGVMPHGGPATAFVSTVPSTASAAVAAVADGAATPTALASRRVH
ncbi:hypothetical protein VaNZ11_009823 [Volvox africanus]|uniref:PPPDE domain-containing protein n=1 Tax=Volvox africanus TaxID=51714 RepID=A0ABQ5S9V6_9CHLO|nr:hypothetical protein VaNZ11_009823 [Volvox africanus]